MHDPSLETLLGNLPGAAYRCLNDPQWTMLFLSAKIRQLTGYAPDELVGNAKGSYADLILPEDQPIVWRDVQRALDADSPFALTYRIRTRDGQVKWVWEQGCKASVTESGMAILDGFITDISQRMRLEQSLKEERRRIRTILDAIPSAIVVLDAAAKVKDANATFCQMYGYSRDQIPSLSAYQLVHPDWHHEIRRFTEEVATTGSFTGSTRDVRSDGTVFPTLVHGVRIQMDDQPMLVAVVRDVTEQEATSQSLRDSEQRFAEFMDHLPAAAVMKDASSRLTFANRFFCDAFSVTNWLGQRYGDLFPESVAAAVHDVDQRVLSDGAATTAIKLPHRDGTHHLFQLEEFAIPVQGAETPLIGGIAMDVTRLVEAHNRLDQESLRTRQLLDTIIDGYILADTTGRILDVNPSYCKLIGWTRDELVDMNVQQLECRLDPKAFRAKVEEFTQSGSARFETCHRAKDGRVIDLEVSLTILQVESMPLVAAFVHDISEQKHARAALTEMNNELEQRIAERTAELRSVNDDLESFAYSVSHDLRAPLRAIEGFSRALAEDFGSQLAQPAHQYLDHITQSARRMDTLISELLSYSRLGRSELRLQQVDVPAVIEEVLETLRPQITACGAEVAVGGEFRPVRAHRSSLHQVMANLLTNALKFVAEGVRPHVQIRGELRSQWQRIWVEDNGIGIAAENQQRVFRVFERLHGVESFPGTGIGLATVQRATAGMAGQCGVESALGEGSRFWVAYRLWTSRSGDAEEA